MIMFIGSHFKTSYVTVYLKQIKAAIKQLEFQNIVCYCLSNSKSLAANFKRISKHRMLLFILEDKYKRVRREHFKTSYVTVYPSKKELSKTFSDNFKTSYVTVYRNI